MITIIIISLRFRDQKAKCRWMSVEWQDALRIAFQHCSRNRFRTGYPKLVQIHMKSGHRLNDFCRKEKPLAQGGQDPMLQTPISQVEEPVGLEVPGCRSLKRYWKIYLCEYTKVSQGLKDPRKGRCLSQMNSDTEEVVKAWNRCQKRRPSQARESMLAQEKLFSWSKVCTELFRMTGKHYVLVLDYYSHVSKIA